MKPRKNVPFSPTVQAISTFLEARCRLDAAWTEDNVGLLVGEPSRTVRKIMLCLDLSHQAVARHPDAELAVCYHPPIYKPISRLLDSSPVHAAIRAGMSLFSPHTGLDVADGGTSDVMAERLGLVEVRPLLPVDRPWNQLKLVVYCPAEATEKLREAICAAGGGGIGKYSNCAFRARGVGSFQGDATSHPAIGESGRLEFVEEDRLEMLVPKSRLHEAIAALRRAHPYEEPAYDLIPLLETHAGIGRIGKLPKPLSGHDLAKLAARAFGVPAAHVAGLNGSIGVSPGAKNARPGKIQTIAVFPGSVNGFIKDLAKSGVDAFVTGELLHHGARELAAAGIVSVCVGHGASERPVLKRVSEWLADEFPGVKIVVDDREAEPFEVVSA